MLYNELAETNAESCRTCLIDVRIGGTGMLWRKRKESADWGQDPLRKQGWNACLDVVEEFLSQHSWVTDEDDRGEIFCDGCGASLPKKLKTLRESGPTRTDRKR